MTMMELERERYREGLELGMEHAKEKLIELYTRVRVQLFLMQSHTLPQSDTHFLP